MRVLEKKLEHVRVCKKYFLLIDFGVHKSTLFDFLTKCLHILYVKPLDKVFIIPCQCYFIFKHFGFQFFKYILSKDSIDQMWPMKCFWWLPKKFHALKSFFAFKFKPKNGKKTKLGSYSSPFCSFIFLFVNLILFCNLFLWHILHILLPYYGKMAYYWNNDVSHEVLRSYIKEGKAKIHNLLYGLWIHF